MKRTGVLYYISKVLNEGETKMKILLCNVTWMLEYAGNTEIDLAVSGGAYVRQHGFGHEALNFLPIDGRVYGFVQLKNKTINISRLDPKAGESIDDVLVVWRARSAVRGSVVVGWYKHATVYRKDQAGFEGRSFKHKGEPVSPDWIITAREEDKHLVPPAVRHFEVPVRQKGIGSRTFVSFLDSNSPQVLKFKSDLLEYIDAVESGRDTVAPLKKKSQVDQFLKQKIERAAVNAVCDYYEQQGYEISDVQSDNVGYDLIASKGKVHLLVEVKGTSRNADNAVVDLTPHEYETCRKKRRNYRICVVTDALAEPCVHEFFSEESIKIWRDENTGRQLILTRVDSARCEIL